MKIFYFISLFALLTLFAASCKSVKSDASNNQIVKTETQSDSNLSQSKTTTKEESNSNAFKKRALYFKTNSKTKVVLPEYDPNKQMLGSYPVLGDIIKAYKVKSISKSFPRMKGMENNYTITFQEDYDLDELITKLKGKIEIEFAEKVPVNSTGF